MRRLISSWTASLLLPKSRFEARPKLADRARYLRRCTDELYSWQQDSTFSPTRDSTQGLTENSTQSSGPRSTFPQISTQISTQNSSPFPNSLSSPSTPFLLLDGPPYANGNLHVGHALNKILKDITCRVQLYRGRKVKYVPGWDCHGLPIEIKALQGQGDLKASVIRKLARELATKNVQEQKAEFRSWAIMGDWENSWSTMDPKFELRQLRIFKSMLEKGLIHRR